MTPFIFFPAATVPSSCPLSDSSIAVRLVLVEKPSAYAVKHIRELMARSLEELFSIVNSQSVKTFPSPGVLNCEPLVSVTPLSVTITSFSSTVSPTENTVSWVPVSSVACGVFSGELPTTCGLFFPEFPPSAERIKRTPITRRVMPNMDFFCFAPHCGHVFALLAISAPQDLHCVSYELIFFYLR